MCFKVTFTHCPYQRHLACQQKQSDVRWQPKHTAYAHTSIVGLCMCDLVSFLFYSLIKPKDLCPIQEVVSRKSLTLSHIFCCNPGSCCAPTHTYVQRGIITKKLTHFSHRSGFYEMRSSMWTYCSYKIQQQFP